MSIEHSDGRHRAEAPGQGDVVSIQLNRAETQAIIEMHPELVDVDSPEMVVSRAIGVLYQMRGHRVYIQHPDTDDEDEVYELLLWKHL